MTCFSTSDSSNNELFKYGIDLYFSKNEVDSRFDISFPKTSKNNEFNWEKSLILLLSKILNSSEEPLIFLSCPSKSFKNNNRLSQIIVSWNAEA